MKFRYLAVFAASTILSNAGAHAEEGMWLPSQAPEIAAQMKAMGAQIAPEDLANLNKAPMNAIASLGNCSASFVSPDGLVVSNHHCVYGSIQYNSKPGQDYLTNGFLAKTNAEEVQAAPGSRIFVIEDLRNVTTDMMKGITAKTLGRARFDALDVNRKALIAACEKQPNRRCDVRAYFGGERYFLQQQLEIKDVRLVYAPAGGVGNYGGETDNWQWPRHTGDFGFYRAYVAPDGSSATYSKDNVPYKPKSWLKISKNGIKEGDFVMLAGFPGSTNRWRSAADVKSTFDKAYPRTQKYLTEYSDMLVRETSANPEWAIKYANAIKSTDNAKKNSIGQMTGAEAIDLTGQKDVEEAEFKKWVAADAKRNAQFGPSIAAYDALIEEENRKTISDIDSGQLGRGALLGVANLLYRWAKEQQKPDAKREAGFQDLDKLPISERLKSLDRRFVPAVDRKVMEWALAKYRTVGEKDRNNALLAKIDEFGLDKLYSETKLGDSATRLAWMGKTPAEFEASTDPFIQLAVAAFPFAEMKLNEAKETSGKVHIASQAMMTARLAYAKAMGKPVYPDANSSLRLTYGKVTGRTQDGVSWAPFTTAEGMAAKNRGKGEFDAPAKAISLIKAKDYGRYAAPELGTLPVNFLTTVDITGGNSGSATLNAKGEFVGLAFDGTLDGVISDWRFSNAINRTIHVDSRYMLWMMDKVDGANRLIKEMGAE